MDEGDLGRSLQELANASARRDVLRSLGAAGLALFAALGLSAGATAGNKAHRNRGHDKHRRRNRN